MDEINNISGPLVSPSWLAANLDKPHILPVDATWSLPGKAPALEDIYIPGATVLDIDETSDPDSPFPHTLAPPVDFAHHMQAMGVNQDTLVVAYDRHGVFSAPRLWWMLRVMGHENVRVLNGGLPAWNNAEHAVKSTPTQYGSGNFVARFRPNLFSNTADMLNHLGNTQIIDARSDGRFRGHTPEPRPGLATGHMPGATNVPFRNLFDDNNNVHPKDELCKVFEAAGIDIKAPVMTTCGSGITACVLALALARLGNWDACVYDGSWVEWASTPDCPIEQD